MEVPSNPDRSGVTEGKADSADRLSESPLEETSGTSAYDRRILRALRRIVRAIDLYSRELKTTCGLTVPQLVCLSAIVRAKQVTAVDLAVQVHLSPSTLVGILDRLEKAGHIQRERNTKDRRQVLIRTTDKGKEAVNNAPSPLQDNLSFGLTRRSSQELATIAESLETIVELMEAQDIKVAPLLTLERKSYAATRAAKKENTTHTKS